MSFPALTGWKSRTFLVKIGKTQQWGACIMAEWVKGKVVQVENWTDALFSLTVHAPVAPFTGGQFTKLGMEIDGERVQRAYSYVNAPSNPNLEFYLVTVPEGKLSPRLHALQPGDEIMLVSEAAGFFVLDEIPDCQTLWMLATGTALGPYLSILQEGKDLDRFENIVLLHAVRYAQDLSYLPLMQKLQQQYEGKLRIQTVVSRESLPGSLTGRVPALIESGELEAAVGLPMNIETSHVMLCGNPQMVRDTQQLLKDTRQMTKHLRRRPGHMTAEHYW
jgi:ferredoxin--NADP+ reductase